MTTSELRAAHMKHIVFFAYDAWGHNRPLCAFVIRIVKAQRTHITYFTPANLVHRVHAELQRNMDSGDTNLLGLIRVVGLLNEAQSPLHHDALDEGFAKLFEALLKGECITCPATGVVYDVVSHVDCVVLDIYANRPLDFIRKRSLEGMKIFVWYSAAATRLLPFNGVERLGGRNTAFSGISTEARRSGRPLTQVAAEVCLACDGSITNIPGLPPMYDYELFPQRVPFREVMGMMLYDTYLTLEGCDGVILSTPECYEQETIRAIRECYGERSRSVFVCGPLVTPSSRTVASGHLSSEAVEIEQMLNRILSERGKGSLLYISFGSLFWPPAPDRLWAILDIVIEMGIPFIMAHASAWAVIPDAVKQKIDAYACGMLMRWCPQQTILAHPATGWFLTHGGHNSVIESINHGVPMICWPYQFDQPTNAMNLTCNLDVAYELFEVRTENGLKPIHRTGRAPEATVESVKREAKNVLQLAFSEDGERKRRNAQRLGAEFCDAWADDGVAVRELRGFLRALE